MSRKLAGGGLGRMLVQGMAKELRTMVSRREDVEYALARLLGTRSPEPAAG